MKQKCLNCKYYRVEDVFAGRCRVDKNDIDRQKLPMMKHNDTCDRWKDAGQQYYIRAGWVKSMKQKIEESDKDVH